MFEDSERSARSVQELAVEDSERSAKSVKELSCGPSLSIIGKTHPSGSSVRDGRMLQGTIVRMRVIPVPN